MFPLYQIFCLYLFIYGFFLFKHYHQIQITASWDQPNQLLLNNNIINIQWHFIDSTFLTVKICRNPRIDEDLDLQWRVARSDSLRRHEEGLLRGSRLRKEPVLFWVPSNSAIRSHYPFTTIYYKVSYSIKDFLALNLKPWIRNGTWR